MKDAANTPTSFIATLSIHSMLLCFEFIISTHMRKPLICERRAHVVVVDLEEALQNDFLIIYCPHNFLFFYGHGRFFYFYFDDLVFRFITAQTSRGRCYVNGHIPK